MNNWEVCRLHNHHFLHHQQIWQLGHHQDRIRQRVHVVCSLSSSYCLGAILFTWAGESASDWKEEYSRFLAKVLNDKEVLSILRGKEKVNITCLLCLVLLPQPPPHPFLHPPRLSPCLKGRPFKSCWIM
jgi:hypothetical protein